MQPGPLADQISDVFEALGTQLQAAARFVLERPSDVALMTMRQQAKLAGVQPHTMTRLAQRLGLSGYDDLRALYAAAIRENALGFTERAGQHVASQKLKGDRALAAEMAETIGRQIARFAEPEALDRLVAAADLLASAERIYCLGLRSCHAVAAQFAYVMSFLGDRAVMLDAAAGTGLDRLRSAGPRDVLIAASVAPYMRATIEAAHYAAGTGAAIVAITDTLASPLAHIAKATILVPTESPSFYHTITPAFAVGEILAALVAGRGGDASLAAIERSEAQMKAFGLHVQTPRPRRPEVTR